MDTPTFITDAAVVDPATGVVSLPDWAQDAYEAWREAAA